LPRRRSVWTLLVRFARAETDFAPGR